MNEDSANIPFINNEPNLSPQSVVDSASLTNSMNKNKESLKVKLLLRRPIDVLVDQGILPPPKSSPAFYEQKLKLERAKTGDFLKHKIQRRPLRDELIQQHILEESFDPCYYEQQRKLKKARLADDLNERLSQRPGPLELIKGNILHTDECLEQAIKEGQITFKKTCEGEVIKNPPKRFVFEEESSSDSAPSPHQVIPSSCAVLSQSNVTNYQLNNPFIVTNGTNLISIPQSEPSKAVAASNVLNSNLSYIVTAPVTNILPNTTSATVFISDKTNCPIVTAPLSNTSANVTTTNQGSKCDPVSQVVLSNNVPQINPQSQKSKKKVKSKNQPKTRIIKFHEYTGPPNVKKQSNSSQSHVETSYELLLKQQQLFLQWQLESQHSFPQIPNQEIDDEVSLKEESNNISNISINKDNDKTILNRDDTTCVSATSSTNGNFQLNQMNTKCDDSMSLENSQPAICSTETSMPCVSASNQTLKQYAPIVKKIISKLEDMKVSDLKAELKKRNLPVSGAKQQLIERLKPFSDSVVCTNNSIVTAELNGTTTIFNLGECKNANQLPNQDILSNGISSNFTAVRTPLAGPTTFILKNSNDVKNGINDELLFITNNNENFPTIPLQLKQPSPITLEAPTLTFPITNTFIPQYQIVSSAPTDNKINLGGINLTSSNSIQTPIANNILVNNKLNILNPQPSLISANLNYNQMANPIGKNSNLTILTGGPIKNGLSFNITQPVLQNSGPVFHQLLLYPTTLNSQDISSLNGPSSINSKQRSNSLPSESLHQLQRNTSLPLVINQVPVSQVSTNSSPSSMHKSNDVNIEKSNISSQQPSNSSEQILTVQANFNKNGLKSTKVADISPNSLSNKDVLFGNIKAKPKNLKPSDYTNIKPTHLNETMPSVNTAGMNCLDTASLAETKTSTTDRSSAIQIQPDSTTNSNSLDLDFILNFDDLTDGFGELHTDLKPQQKMVLGEQIDYEMNHKNSNEQSKSNAIDFNDNWFDITFGNSASNMSIEMMEESSKLMESETGTPSADCSFLDSINQIFDQSYSICSTKGSEQQLDHTKQDPAVSHNLIASTSGAFVGQSSYPIQQCHFSANYSTNSVKYNNLNGSNNAFLMDSVGEFFLEDSDFKNSIDFPILLDS